jgi:hypothetical protein
MPGGGGVSAGLFTLVGVAGLPGSSPNHGLNPELVAGWGEVDSVDAAGVIVEPAEPDGSVDEVLESLGLDNPAAAPCVDVESSQNPGLTIVIEAATANTNAKFLAT